jgi:hypothetical protein
MGKWSDPWWRSFLTLHDSKAFLRGGRSKNKINGRFMALFRPGDSALGQQKIKEMCSVERNKYFIKGVIVCLISTP